MPNKNEKLGNCIWFYLLRKHLAPTHQQKGSTYLITFEESFSSSHSICSVKRVVQKQLLFFLEQGRSNKVFPHNLMVWTPPSLSVCQEYSVSKVLFSLLICMSFRTSTSCQSEIFGLIAWTPLAFSLLVWAEREYITLVGCAGPGKPIHTYEQRAQDFGDRIFLVIWAERMPFMYVPKIWKPFVF